MFAVSRLNTRNALSLRSLSIVVAVFIAATIVQPPAWAGGEASDQNDRTPSERSTRGAQHDQDRDLLTYCSDPRPQNCTREYRPVCAQLQDGRFKTFATGCTACSDPDVAGYVDGACE